MARRRGRTAVDAHLSTSESGCLLRHGLPCGIVVGPGHRSLLPPRRLPPIQALAIQARPLPNDLAVLQLGEHRLALEQRRCRASPRAPAVSVWPHIVVSILIVMRSPFDRGGLL